METGREAMTPKYVRDSMQLADGRLFTGHYLKAAAGEKCSLQASGLAILHLSSRDIGRAAQ